MKNKDINKEREDVYNKYIASSYETLIQNEVLKRSSNINEAIKVMEILKEKNKDAYYKIIDDEI